MVSENWVYIGDRPLEPPEEYEQCRCQFCAGIFENQQQYNAHLPDCDGVD